MRLAAKMKARCQSVGFIPTMGALHEGHLSLIRQARQENDKVVVSIFVNPAQFGPREDFKKYPRTFRRDAQLCQKEGVDIVFSPQSYDMYPKDFKTYVKVEDLSEVLCGKFRPGHFRGVTTVVAKLFNIVQPKLAYFGQKDAQQAIIIKKMASDLNMPISVKVMPTVREKDGLALSSRNVYLNPQERKDALALSQSLQLARVLINSGVKDLRTIVACIKKHILAKKNAKIDYIAVVEPVNLRPLKKISNGCLIALAVRIGKTRLIDNIVIKQHG